MRVIIVGAGITGLATAHILRARRPGLQITVLEASKRTGGKVWTERTAQGYACEWGVNGFLDNKPRTLELASTLGLDPLRGAAESARRYVYRSGRLHRLPESPQAFLASRLLSFSGRLRVMLEPFIKRGEVADETLADFARRRLGKEALQALIDPMASGVFAGNPEEMSLQSCFPRIHQIEQQYGSLIRGMIKLQRESRKSGKGPGPGPGPGGTLTSFRHGMSEMTDELAGQLGSAVRIGAEVQSVTREGSLYQAHLADGSSLESEFMVLAAPAWAQAAMLREIAPGISKLLAEIPYPPLAVACIGYRQQDLASTPDGFGYLVPSSEGSAVLGTVIDSNVFPERAPPGSVLLRSMVGGSRAPGLALRQDAQILDSVRSALQSVLGIRAEPEFAKVHVHHRAIPQYRVGHAARLAQIEAALEKHPGLMLTGNAFRGVSLNDCVANALTFAEQFPGS